MTANYLHSIYILSMFLGFYEQLFHECSSPIKSEFGKYLKIEDCMILETFSHSLNFVYSRRQGTMFFLAIPIYSFLKYQAYKNILIRCITSIYRKGKPYGHSPYSLAFNKHIFLFCLVCSLWLSVYEHIYCF